MFGINHEDYSNEPITDTIVRNCHLVIWGLIILTVAIGISTGYYFHKGEAELMFVPLFIAFITVFIGYMFIDLRSELVAGNKPKALKLCDIYFLVLIFAAVAIGVVTGYFFHKGEAMTMFLPLLVAFICVMNGYLFIEIKGQLVADKAVEKY